MNTAQGKELYFSEVLSVARAEQSRGAARAARDRATSPATSLEWDERAIALVVAQRFRMSQA